MTPSGPNAGPVDATNGLGTHNLLLRLGETAYLEMIAPDPTDPPPGRPRWFGLNEMARDTAPRLAAWVARTDDILATVAASPEPLGPVESMSRGDLRWNITIPPDGTLPLDGAGPLLIHWDAALHPATRLPDDGFELIGLTVTHLDPDRVTRLLSAIGFVGPVTVVAGQHVGLVAKIRTPVGIRRI